jgi:hypothetical protein
MGTLHHLPDSRARVARGVVRGVDPSDGVVKEWVPAFCFNCGAPDGYVTTTARKVTNLCNKCVEKHGVPAGLVACGPDEWQERIAEATSGLSVEAIAEKLDDPNSLLTKLAGDYARACSARGN